MPRGSRSIITLTTDFGTRDFYVGAMKGAILRHAPDVTLVDMTHDVPRHDVRFGCVVLERGLSAFGPGAVHLAVVDPGVGTSRRMLIARWPDAQLVVCPDNG